MKYVGFSDGYHILVSRDGKEVVKLKEGKYFDAPTSVTLLLKDDGGIEPTYMSVRRLGQQITGEVCARLMKADQHLAVSI